MKTVYFDESGQTGTNLFDRDQPFFTIGSTDTEPGEAADIIAACFPRHAGDELKSKRFSSSPEATSALSSSRRRSPSGRFVDIARDPAVDFGLGHFLLLLIEPVQDLETDHKSRVSGSSRAAITVLIGKRWVASSGRLNT